MPPSRLSGSGANRVQSTTPSGYGSPDATPSLKGWSEKRVLARAQPDREWPVPARAANAPAPESS
jgi:hypothetical protein